MKALYFIFCSVFLLSLSTGAQETKLTLQYNKDSSTSTLSDQNGSITGSYSIDLANTALTIIAKDFPKDYLIEDIPEIKYEKECPRVSLSFPNIKQLVIKIEKGGMLLSDSLRIRVGAGIKISTPKNQQSWVINTNLQITPNCSVRNKETTQIVPDLLTVSGIPFYDALELGDPAVDAFRKFNILKFYAGLNSSASYRELELIFIGNKDIFLLELLHSIDKELEQKGVKHGTLGEITSTTLGAIGNLDVTNFADGLAKFLVERTKSELNSYFFKRFKNDLDKIPQLKILFPFTFKALMAIDKNIYNYSAYLNLLRDCFQKDLALILPDMEKLVNDTCMDRIFAANPALRTMLADGLFIVNDLRSGTHPGAVLHDYVFNCAEPSKLALIHPDLYPGFQALDLLSQSFRSKSTDQYWVGVDSLKMLIRDTLAFKIYIGLIYQQAFTANITFSGGITMTSVILEAGKYYHAIADKYVPYFTGLAEKGKKLDYCFNQIKQKSKTGNDKPGYQDYFDLYDASLDLFEQVKGGLSLFGRPLPVKTGKNINLFFFTARTAGTVYVDLYEKQYSSAIVGLSTLFDSLFIKQNLPSIQGTKDAQIFEVPSLIMKYGGLAASISNAENSDQVQEAIEAYSMPAGSSSVKRESQFNVSLNAYVGVFAGHEFIQGTEGSLFINNYGISAPVGVSVSLGGIKCNPKSGGNSLGLFVSVIDIGALASFRFGDDSTSTVPTIKLQDIIAPGIFFSWGIAGTPFSLAAGAQIGPLLREVAPSINTSSDNYYWRAGVTFTVDIPILNFYNKGVNKD